jgi:hypothetical protein
MLSTARNDGSKAMILKRVIPITCRMQARLGLEEMAIRLKVGNKWMGKVPMYLYHPSM